MKTLIAILILILSSPAFADDSELRYNPMENTWNYEDQSSELKFNPFEGNWSYENPKSELKYNPMENHWEYAK